MLATLASPIVSAAASNAEIYLELTRGYSNSELDYKPFGIDLDYSLKKCELTYHDKEIPEEWGVIRGYTYCEIRDIVDNLWLDTAPAQVIPVLNSIALPEDKKRICYALGNKALLEDKTITTHDEYEAMNNACIKKLIEGRVKVLPQKSSFKLYTDFAKYKLHKIKYQ